VRVKRSLDGAHHVHGAFTRLGTQEVHFVQPNAVFARARAT
jgi:hypothetical protein